MALCPVVVHQHEIFNEMLSPSVLSCCARRLMAYPALDLKCQKMFSKALYVLGMGGSYKTL